MDGDALLRQWLAQQRELGDSELVFSSLSARQALDLVSHRRVRPAMSPAISAAPSATPDRSNASSPGPEPLGIVSGSVDRPTSDDDWRTALHAAGAGPRAERGPKKRDLLPDAAPAAPPMDRDAPVELPPDARAAATIEQLAELIRTCRGCTLFRTALNPVPGEGNPRADLVCVGEAPGATEDQLGRPFVGQAGQLLTKILAAVNLEREDVFIMNVLKHRPPGNRNPDPDEVVACKPFLLRQVELIQPKVILALGTFAAQTLLETREALGRLRGRVHSFQGIPVVVTYHPAALLRNPAWKRPTWEDVQLARRILDGTGA
ncbi:MAG TPA: uracil-DNA glycosylase [Gemmatimonadaceae bacterium]|nr:uracil-DNA glycosylase [Gemmatimonadaceae bacterium]